MARSTGKFDIYLEVGKKRTFAGAIDWPGWCRSGRDEQAAVQALFEYGPRYASIMSLTGFKAPESISDLRAVERLKGNGTTDFGAPDMAPTADADPVGTDDLLRFQTILKACWEKFDGTVKAAKGKELLKGPRGGGRELDEIVQHVTGAEAAYLGRLGGKPGTVNPNDRSEMRLAILKTLESAARGEVAESGPRGGKRWGARYFVRRTAWHVLDHAWEIEDRNQAD